MSSVVQDLTGYHGTDLAFIAVVLLLVLAMAVGSVAEVLGNRRPRRRP